MKYLFPHKAQIVSFLILLIDLFAILTLVSISVINNSPTGEHLQSLLLIVAYLAIFVCVFSREKIEDEFISSLRLNSIGMVSCIAFIFIITLNIIQLVLPHDGFLAMKEWRMNLFWNGNFFIILAVLYLLILKISIRCNNR